VTLLVLDTNVLSEVMRGRHMDAGVRAWLGTLTATPVTTVVNRAEILAGIALLPPGHRRETLRTAAAQALDGLGVCLPLTDGAAEHYADIVATRRALGRPVGGLDALIAAIVRQVDGRLATRDTADFDGLGLTLVDPWQAT